MPKAAVLTEPNRIEIIDRPCPEPGPNEARIRVAAAGVCGTDIAIFSGDYQTPLPLVLGHEFAGRVEAVGSEGDGHLVGQRATAEINNTCLARRLEDPCPACRRGMPSHCLSRTVLGIAGADGAFAEHVIVPAENVHLVPDTVDDTAAIFIEPLAAAIQTFELTPISSGDTVMVLGTGRLGSLICAVARECSSREGKAPAEPPRVLAVDPDPRCRERALKLGADSALAPSEDLPDRIRSETGGLGADVVVEATGNPHGLNIALSLVRPRGTIALKSTCGLPSDVDQTKVVVNEVRVQGSRCGPFDRAVRVLGQGKLDTGLWHGSSFPLNRTAPAIEAARTCDKVLIRP